MIRPIVLWPDPVLSTPADPVGEIDAETLILVADMLETMYAAPGRGLAAPQVGVSRRLFVMDTTWKDGERAPRVVVDPEIVDRSNETATCEEGCLSIPGVLVPVERPAEITMRWRDETGAVREERLTGFDAICAQHEFDHLEGRVTFDRVPDDVRAEAEAAYAS